MQRRCSHDILPQDDSVVFISEVDARQWRQDGQRYRTDCRQVENTNTVQRSPRRRTRNRTEQKRAVDRRTGHAKKQTYQQRTTNSRKNCTPRASENRVVTSLEAIHEKSSCFAMLGKAVAQNSIRNPPSASAKPSPVPQRLAYRADLAPLGILWLSFAV